MENADSSKTCLPALPVKGMTVSFIITAHGVETHVVVMGGYCHYSMNYITFR